MGMALPSQVGPVCNHDKQVYSVLTHLTYKQQRTGMRASETGSLALPLCCAPASFEPPHYTAC